jgi:hypothetical protein
VTNHCHYHWQCKLASTVCHHLCGFFFNQQLLLHIHGQNILPGSQSEGCIFSAYPL